MATKVTIREVRTTELLVKTGDLEEALDLAREIRESSDYTGAILDDCSIDYMVGGQWIEIERQIRSHGDLVGFIESRAKLI